MYCNPCFKAIGRKHQRCCKTKSTKLFYAGCALNEYLNVHVLAHGEKYRVCASMTDMISARQSKHKNRQTKTQSELSRYYNP